VRRAVATGAVALESGAAARERLDEAGQRAAAAAATGTDDPTTLRLIGETRYYRVFGDDGSSRVAVVDDLGTVPVCEPARQVITGADHEALLAALRSAVDDATTKLGIGTPAACVHRVRRTRRRPLRQPPARGHPRGCERAIDGHEGTAVAVVWR
jgi:hypothetical protein